MALSKLKIYQKAIGILSDLESEIKQDSLIEKALQDLKNAYFQRPSAKQKTLFVKKMHKQCGNVDLPLVTFYHRTLEESRKNIGDGPLWKDSGIVTETIAFLQKHFGTKVLAANHFTQLGEELKQAIISKELCTFLESKMDASGQVGEIASPPVSKEKRVGDYTKKRQAIALYVLLKAFGLESDNRANVGRILHLLVAQPIPKKKDAAGNTAWNSSDYYNAYGDVVNGKYSDADLDFVQDMLRALHHEDRRNRPTVFDSAFEELRKNLKVLTTRQPKNKKED